MQEKQTMPYFGLTCQNHSGYSQSGQALAEDSRHLNKMDKYTQKKREKIRGI